MPSRTGSVQDATSPGRPSTSTMHTRQDPKALKLSVAQSLGMSRPAMRAARKMDVPPGTETRCPSMVAPTSGNAWPFGAAGGVP